jgi:hypothetical protein
VSDFYVDFVPEETLLLAGSLAPDNLGDEAAHIFASLLLAPKQRRRSEYQQSNHG